MNKKSKEKSFFSMSVFAKNLVESLWDESNIHKDRLVTRAALLIYYLQYLSWIFRSDQNDILLEEGVNNLLSSIISYVSIIPLFKGLSTSLIYFISILVIIIDACIISYLFGSPIVHQYLNRRKASKESSKKQILESKSKLRTLLRKLLYKYFALYICVLFSPKIEFFFNLFVYCGDDRSLLPEQRLNDSCQSFGLTRIIIGLVGISLTLINFIIALWAFRSFDFLEKDSLRNRMGTWKLLVLLIRLIIGILFVVIPEDKAASVMLSVINLGVAIEALEFCLEFKTYNRDCYIYQAQVILMSLILTWAWTFLKFLHPKNGNLEILVFSFLGSTLGLKLGQIFGNWLFNYNVLKMPFVDNKDVDILKKGNFDFVLELIMASVSKNKASSQEASYQADQMEVLGFMIQHMRLCTNPHCWFRRGRLDEFVIKQEEEKKRLFLQVCNFFFNLYLNPKGNVTTYTGFEKREKNFERIVLKFYSFLAFENNNPIHSFYYICKIQKMLSKRNCSLFFKIASKMLQDVIKKRQAAYDTSQKEILSNIGLSVGRELDVSGIETLLNSNEKFRLLMLELILLKQKYLEGLKEGWTNSDQLISSVVNMQHKFNSFKHSLKSSDSLKSMSENKWKSIISTKYSSLYYSVLTNCLTLAIKYEEEIIKIMTLDNLIDRDFLSLSNFFSGNILIVEASFLGHTGGRLLEQSKGKKFTSFFDYSAENIGKIEQLSDLMSENVGPVHGKFISNYINQERNINTKEKRFFVAFARDSKEFLFPIKIYPRINLNVRQDFQMMAALLKLDNNKRFILADIKGQLIGLNHKMFKILMKNSESRQYDPILYKNINIFMMMPQLSELVRKKLKNQEKTRDNMNVVSLTSDFFVPRNMDAFLEELENRKVSNSSGRQKSEFYSMSNTIRMNTYRSKKTSQSFYTIRQSEVSYYEEIQEPDKSNLLSAVVNLNFFTHSWGKEADEKLEYFQIEIERLRKASQQMMDSIKKKFKKRGQNSEISSFHQENSLNISQDLAILQENVEKFSEMPTMNTAKLLLPPTVAPKFENVNNLGLNPPMNNDKELDKELQELDYQENKSIGQVSGALPVIEEQDSIDSDDSKKQNGSGNSKSEGNSAKNLSNLQRNTETVKIAQKQASVQGSSLNSSARSSNVIYSVISQLQSYKPLPLVKLGICLLLDLLLIIIYSTVLYIISDNYVSNDFIPLRSSLSNFGEIGNSLSFTALASFEKKLENTSKISYAMRSMDKSILNMTLHREFVTLKEKYLNENRNIYSTLKEYQRKFKEDTIIRKDVFSGLMEAEPGEGYITDNLVYLHNLISGNEMSLRQRLFPIDDFIEGKNYIEGIKGNIEFLSSDTTNTQLRTFLLMFICFCLASIIVRFIAIHQVGKFYVVVMRVLKLFLRLNEEDILTEIEILSEATRVLQKYDDSYFKTSFPALYLTFDQKGLPNKRIDSMKKINNGKIDSSAEKKKKKRNVYTMDPPKRTWFYVGFLLNLLLVFIFFSTLYFLWQNIDTNIDNIVATNIFISDILVLPNTLLASTALVLNELIYGRSDNFKKILDNHEMVLHRYHLLTINVEEFIFVGQSDEYEKVMRGNICEVLNIEDPELLQICSTILEGSFKKGIVYVLAELENNLSLEQYYIYDTDQTIQDIENYIKSENHFDTVKACYFIDMALNIFKQYSEQYFTDKMLSDITNFKIVLICLCALFLLIEMILTRMLLINLVNLFSNMMASLYLIPFNSLAKDEKLRNLIKQVNN